MRRFHHISLRRRLRKRRDLGWMTTCAADVSTTFQPLTLTGLCEIMERFVRRPTRMLESVLTSPTVYDAMVKATLEVAVGFGVPVRLSSILPEGSYAMAYNDGTIELYSPEPKPTYRVRTWDAEAGEWTPQAGLSLPSHGLSLGQLRAALKELRQMGYSCHRTRDGDSDPFVLVEKETTSSL
jgi:hypothetical protein